MPRNARRRAARMRASGVPSRSLLLRTAVVLALSSAAPAGAVEYEDCENYCVDRGARLAEACQEPDCQQEVEARVAACVEQLCLTEVAPSADQIAALARRHAETAFGGPLYPYAVIDQQATDEVVLSRLFIFATRDDVAPPEQLMVEFDHDPGARRWLDLFRCVEVGVGPATPPVIGYWRGLPAEYALTQKARRALARELGDDAAARAPVVRRYGPSIAPVLALRHGRETWYFDTTSRHVLTEFVARRREGIDRDPAHIERRLQFKALWLARLAELTEE